MWWFCLTIFILQSFVSIVLLVEMATGSSKQSPAAKLFGLSVAVAITVWAGVLVFSG